MPVRRNLHVGVQIPTIPVMGETQKPQGRITLSERGHIENIEELLEGEPLYHLDPSVKIYWSVWVVAAGLLLWLLAMAVSEFSTESILGIEKGLFPIAFLTLIVLLMLPYFLWVELSYNNYTYQFRGRRLVIKRGVLNTERAIIPYTKIQNINVNRNAIQRVMGLSTIRIETAGANPGESEGVIDGIGNHEKFIKHTMELVERRKAAERAAPAPVGGEAETELAYLKRILGELIELKKVMGPKDNPQEPSAAPAPKKSAGKPAPGRAKRSGGK